MCGMFFIVSIDTCRAIHSDSIPATTGYITNGGLMLVHRREWWTNIKPPLGQRLELECGSPPCGTLYTDKCPNVHTQYMSYIIIPIEPK